MAIEVLIVCCGALYATGGIVWCKEVTDVIKIALHKQITVPKKPSKLNDFLNAGSNRKIARCYFYEAPMIRCLYFISVLFTILVLAASAIITIAASMGEHGFQVPPFIARVMYFAVVLSIASSYGCRMLARR